MRAWRFLLAIVGLSAGLVFAQTGADPLDACAAEKDDAARLACFDRQMAARHQHTGAQPAAASQTALPHAAQSQPQAQAAVPPTQTETAVPPAQIPPSHGQTALAPPLGAPPPPTPAQSQAAPAAPDANYGLQGAALQKKLKEEGRQAHAPPPVSATVARLVRLSATEYAFQLDNGQIWQQTDGRPDLSVRVNDRVTINPGIFGDFFFTTPDRQRVRVKRVR